MKPSKSRFCGFQLDTILSYSLCVFFHCCFRYIFKNTKKVGLQELGPRFTLKLRSLQFGAFDPKFGEYEWIHKVCAQVLSQSTWGPVNIYQKEVLQCTPQNVAINTKCNNF